MRQIHNIRVFLNTKGTTICTKFTKCQSPVVFFEQSPFFVLLLCLVLSFLVKPLYGDQPQTSPLSEQNYYAPKQSCVTCHETEFRQWYDSNHHRAMGDPVSDGFRGDFNDTQYIHVGFDDLAVLSDAELKTVLAEVDLAVIARGLTDAKLDVLPRINAVLLPEDQTRLQELMRFYAATVTVETATAKRSPDGSVMIFGNACPVRAGDAQLAHAEVVDAMQKLATDGKINLSFGQLYRFTMQRGRPMVECENSRGERETFAVKYTFGNSPMQQYLVEFDDGRVQCLPVTWDVERGRWFHLYPKERILHDDVLFWTRPAQNWNYMCANCHTTNLHKNYDVATNMYHTRWSEMSVGCQSCHGPGGLHVERMSIPGIATTGNRTTDMALPIFSQMTARDEIETCAPCHAHRRVLREGAVPPGSYFLDYYVPALIDGNLFYADGQILEEDYEYTSFMQCRMSVENVRCTTCHDPHSSKLTHEGNNLCLQCHDASYDSPKHHFHEDATQPGTQCVACHAPTTNYMVIRPRHDHNFKVPDPELTIRLGIPNACNNCHNDPASGETPEWALRWVRHWYGTPVPAQTKSEHYAFAISGGRNGDADALPKLLTVAVNHDTKQVRPIVRASAISLLGRYPNAETLAVRTAALSDKDPHVRLAATLTFESAMPDERLAHLLPLLADGKYAIRCEAARLLSVVPPTYIPAGAKSAFDSALREYIASQDASLDHPAAHLNLAVLWENLAMPDIFASQDPTPATIRKLTQKSLDAYHQALAIDPDFLPARINLAMLHNNFRNEPQEAELHLRRVTELAPDNGEGFYSLALFLAEQKRLDEASTAFTKAVSLLPGHARVLYNHGVLLLQLGKTDESERQLIRAYNTDQTSVDILSVLVNISLQKQEYEKALGRIQLLRRLEPNNPRWVTQFNQVQAIYQREGNK